MSVDKSSSSSDVIEQTTRKAARLMAKTAADQAKPDRYNAYVAAATKTILDERGAELRALAATGIGAEQLADHVEPALDPAQEAISRAFPGSKTERTDDVSVAKQMRDREQTRRETFAKIDAEYEHDDDKRAAVLAANRAARRDEKHRNYQALVVALAELGYPDAVTNEDPIIVTAAVPVRVVWQAKAVARFPHLPCWSCQSSHRSGSCRATGRGVEDCSAPTVTSQRRLDIDG